MALKPCRECGAQVSTEAEVCPHCGVRSPTTSDPLADLGSSDSKQANTSKGERLKVIGVIALIIFGLVVLVGALFPEDKTQPDIATPAAPAASSGTTRPPVAQLPLPGKFTGRDILRLQREMDANSKAFFNEYVGKAAFSDTGHFQEFGRLEFQPHSWMVLVNLVGGQAACIYDHLDTSLARMIAGQAVRISGTVGMPLKSAIMLMPNCSVTPN